MKFKKLFDEISQQTTKTMCEHIAEAAETREGPVDLRSCGAGERMRTGPGQISRKELEVHYKYLSELT